MLERVCISNATPDSLMDSKKFQIKQDKGALKEGLIINVESKILCV